LPFAYLPTCNIIIIIMFKAAEVISAHSHHININKLSRMLNAHGQLSDAELAEVMACTDTADKASKLGEIMCSDAARLHVRYAGLMDLMYDHEFQHLVSELMPLRFASLDQIAAGVQPEPTKRNVFTFRLSEFASVEVRDDIGNFDWPTIRLMSRGQTLDITSAQLLVLVSKHQAILMPSEGMRMFVVYVI
jgi:hypothetical protein